MTRVLVVDDERSLLRALAMNLVARGYEVTEAETGTQALTAAAETEHDVILLDLGLPDVSGLDVIRGVRGYASTPIIVLSARAGSADKVQALDLGADDYVTKPFSMEELLARLRAATRRASTNESAPPVTVGEVQIDLARQDGHRRRRQADPPDSDRVASARDVAAPSGQTHHRTRVAHRTARSSGAHGSELPAHLHGSASTQARTRTQPAEAPDHRARHGVSLPTLIGRCQRHLQANVLPCVGKTRLAGYVALRAPAVAPRRSMS